MRYISVKQIDNYLEGKSYNTIHKTVSVKGMKKLNGWHNAKEIVYSGEYIYAIF